MTTANDLLLDAYGRVAESVPAVVAGLSPDGLARRPAGGGNPIGWLVWHLTRVFDDHLADAFGTEQVWAAGGFADRAALDLPDTNTGYAHDDAQVDAVRLDAGLLADYHRACQDAYRAPVAAAADWDRVVDLRWDPPVTLAVRLVSVGDDMARHIGQAEYVRGMLDRGSAGHG